MTFFSIFYLKNLTAVLSGEDNFIFFVFKRNLQKNGVLSQTYEFKGLLSISKI